MNQKQPTILAAAMLLCICSFAQRQQLKINNNWKFSFGHAANPEKDFN